MNSKTTKTNGSFKSVDGKTEIHYYSVLPNGKPKAVVQFLHGMAEHSERYNEFAEYLALNDIAFYISDHLGHGKSIADNECLGFFAEQDGWQSLVKDAKTLGDIIKENHPKTPFIVAGHSMGSFVCRAFVSFYKDFADGAIFVGTGNATPITSVGTYIGKMFTLFKGKKGKSALMQKLSFGSYNDRIENPKSKNDWLSRDAKEVEAYDADELCGFDFSVSGFADVAAMMSFVSSKNWADTVSKTAPIYIIAGGQDPVGNYGKDIRTVAEMLKSSGVQNVKHKIYADDRHEILNELDKQAVFCELLNWINNEVVK